MTANYKEWVRLIENHFSKVTYLTREGLEYYRKESMTVPNKQSDIDEGTQAWIDLGLLTENDVLPRKVKPYE